MEIRKDLESLSEIVSEKLGDKTRRVRSNGMTDGDLDTIDKLTHTLKSIKGVLRFMDEDGYSSHYPYMDGGSYTRSRNPRRDSMGRYSSEYGYSRSDLAEKMRELMDEAPDDRTRQEMKRMVEKLETA